jgi:subtilisin-like proprotein convertase family protein
MKPTIAVILVLLVACGPQSRRGGPGPGDDDGLVDSPPAVGPEICDDGVDNDGDGKVDCSDVDCSGIGNCPVCGQVDNPEGQPLVLPDGINSGKTCSTDVDCAGSMQNGQATPNCISKECHASYVSTLNFVGFPANTTLDDPNKLLKVCVTMEHSWLRDLQMELIAPNGTVIILDKWHDRTTLEEIYLGQANDSDDDATPVPGVGMEYCWTPTGQYEMINQQSGAVAPTTQSWNSHTVLSPGDYKSSSPWTAFTGVPLNGMWSIRVTDLWGIDNGYIFKWSIAFDPSLVSDCAGPIIL